MRVLVIGAGIFGCSAAIEVANDKHIDVTLIDQDLNIMRRASRCNHNRLHLGYHYLRSKPTANQSLEGLLSFMFNFGNAVISQFPNYYAIAREGSKSCVADFIKFCDTVGIGYDDEYPDERIMNREMLEGCFKVPEPIFDHNLLKEIILGRIHKQHNISLKLNTKCQKITKDNKVFSALINDKVEYYDIIVNASYSNINFFDNSLELNTRNLLFEEVIIPYFLYPSDKFGLTIMDGDFCSVMPKGVNKNEFLLYHVKYSILQSQIAKINTLSETEVLEDRVDKLYKESTLFFPFLKDIHHFGYWKTFRTVHENKDDARVTELFTYPEMENYYTILSGKISTCMQVGLHLRHIIQGKEPARRFKI
ncbi:FAD-dependent oxidoreductase [Catalinimonas niigatensis]|uniref:FAD-dependent oxidoreductase n=1 Tax=Catalinimonas niigatensis TaxID=1397264 RepID=UPI00266632C5|nr:FAD-dependent oxidoreductase [Catalinimonas niigatensis]WPP52632.1 FAD-dependent oxidoreductase [Catalinimonas niigatensis]